MDDESAGAKFKQAGLLRDEGFTAEAEAEFRSLSEAGHPQYS
jgi:hypothetical protein